MTGGVSMAQGQGRNDPHDPNPKKPRKITLPDGAEKVYCPDCCRVRLLDYSGFWICPDCNGELWEDTWHPGLGPKDEIKPYVSELMQPPGAVRTKKARSSKSGRRRKKKTKVQPRYQWLDRFD